MTYKVITLLELYFRDSHNFMKGKLEFKFTLEQATKALRGGRYITVLFL